MKTQNQNWLPTFMELPITELLPNEGQIEGVPANPRHWSKDEEEKVARSLEETPELYAARPCIVYPLDGKYIVIGGNLRLASSKVLGLQVVPCAVQPVDTPAWKLKEIASKDNVQGGHWDYDMLREDWGDFPWEDWGVPAWETPATEAKAEAHEDDFDESKDVVKCRAHKGEVWVCGNHRVMCGDSTDTDSVKRLMGGGIG